MSAFPTAFSRVACVAVFDGRAAEAVQVGLVARQWLPLLVAHRHWAEDYRRAANSAGLGLSLGQAVAEVNAWISEIDRAPASD